MKGIILAGGSGTRLYPITKFISKQLLPVYDKPMIYYPLSILMLAGIKDILIICTEEDIDKFKTLFEDGSQLGIKIEYKIQPSPDGLAQAFILGEDFIGNDNVCLILGDNLFYGHNLPQMLRDSVNLVNESNKSVVYGYRVDDPTRYGIVDFDEKGKALSIEEKPEHPKSNFAVVGLYFYTNDVIQIAKSVKPSLRGELEITSVNQEYLTRDKLHVEIMRRGFTWLDTGTHESLLQASQFIEIVEKRQGLKIGCIEEIAFHMGYIDKDALKKLMYPLRKNSYGQYLLKIINDI